MVDPFVAEIRIFGFNFPPSGWAHCNGQLMPLSQNTALFSLLGTTYGGDGKSTFALPNLQDAAPMHQGQGSGLSNRNLGAQAGVQFVTLLESEIPAHAHAIRASTQNADIASPGPAAAIGRSVGQKVFAVGTGTNQPMAPQNIAPVGGSLPHNNLMPYLVMNFCIALQGVFPQRP